MSQISWYRQLGLALLLFGLGSGAIWLEYKHKPAQEALEEQGKKIFQLSDHNKEDLIQSIALISPQKRVILNCAEGASRTCKPGDNSKWEILDPLKAKADDSNVNSLVSSLNNLKSTESINLKEETPEKKAALLKEYGLDSTSRKNTQQIRVKTAQGESTLYLGLTHPIGESIFAIVEKGNSNENSVYLIPTQFKSNLDHDLSHWRDKRLFSLSAQEIESFQIENPKGRFSAERKNGKWTLHAAQEELQGDIETVDSLLSTGVFLSAKSFLSDSKGDPKALSTLKGTSKVASLSIQQSKGTSKETPAPLLLNLFQKKDKGPTQHLYATVSNLDPVFEIDPSSLDRLNKSAKELRLSKLITSMDRFAAKHLEFSGTPIGPTSLKLSEKEGKWILESNKKEASKEKVQELLDKLSGNRIKDFLKGTAVPSGSKEGLILTLEDEKSSSKRQFVFWKNGDLLYAKDLLAPKEEAFLVDKVLKDALPWNSTFFNVEEKKLDQPKK